MSIAAATIPCPECQTPWTVPLSDETSLMVCPGCAREGAAAVFPAFMRPAVTASLPEKLVIEGEASCFYHADKRAAVPCSSCGRFLCALCDIVVGERHLCPACIESGRTKGKFLEFETNRTLWDSAALTLAVLPTILCFYVSVFTAPAAIIVAIMGWKKPSSIIPRGRWRLWIAIVLSVLQIAAWVIGGIYIAQAISNET